MGRKPISETGELLDDRIVLKSSKALKTRFTNMCKAVKENPSERIRRMLEADLELYDIMK